MQNEKCKMKNLILFLGCALFMFAAGCAATGIKKATQGEPAVLSSIDVLADRLNIVVDRPFTYTVYKSSDPYKVIVELPDVRLGSVPQRIRADRAGITEITIIQIDEPISSRIEILLASPVNVEPVYKDTSLAILVKEEPETKAPDVASIPKAEEEEVELAPERPDERASIPVAEVKEEPPTLKPEPQVVAPAPEIKVEPSTPKYVAPTIPSKLPKELSPATTILQVNIEKEPGILKVVIKGNGSMNPDVFRLDNRAILDIPNVKIAASLPSAVLPLKNIRAGKHIDKTRLVLDMKEGTSFDVAAVEDSVIVSFRIPEEKPVEMAAEKAAPITPAETMVALMPETRPVEGKYKGQRISLDFQNADIVPIFRLLADISGYNFVIDPSVRGSITLKLMNVPWDQALDIILQTFSLGKSIEGNIIWIAPTAMFTKMAEEKTKTKVAEEILEELVQEVIRVNYATASEISGAINTAKLMTTRGSITMDNRMNTLIIKDTQKSIDKIKELLKIMDVAKPQVMIEAKIVEVSSDYSQALGIRWGGSFYAPVSPSSLSGDFSVNTPTSSAGSSAEVSGGALALTIGNANTVNVNLSLSALETIGKSRRLSNPKILTMDNEAATINQGTSVPYPTVSAEGTKIEFVQATLSLNVTPRITPDGYVQLKISATNNALGSATTYGYSIDTKSVNTQALVKNGDTLVIGGIYTTDTIESSEGIPVLSKIPFLGWLFKTQTQTGPNVKELLVFITPTIVGRP
jgi:type IV pilus secretin PilQ/predicted competence protein